MLWLLPQINRRKPTKKEREKKSYRLAETDLNTWTYFVLASLLWTWHKLLSWKKNLSWENFSIRLPNRYLMWKGPAHFKQCHPWAGSSRFYKKAGRTSHENKPLSSTPSWLCISSFLQVSALLWVPSWTSLYDGLVLGQSQTNPFLPKMFLVSVLSQQ